jgi:hypothetical protein
MKYTNPICILICLFSFYCASVPESRENLESVSYSMPTESKIQKYITNLSPAEETAKFFAGSLPPEHPVFSENYYADHREKMKKLNESWERTRSEILKWKSSEKIETKTIDHAFYPFSGADFLNFYSMYPEAKTYSMFGLEHVEKLTNLNSKTPSQRKKAIQDIEKLFSSIVQRNYFTYRLMKEVMSSSEFPGIVPVLLTMLSWTNHVIKNLEISENTVIIQFHEKNSKTIKTLHYKKIFLSNSVYSQNSTESNWLKNLPKKGLLLKSAEYILHDPVVSLWQKEFLKGAVLVIQDDSGFPVDSFPLDQWTHRFYGHYDQAFLLKGVRTPQEQSYLRETFQNTAKPLPFDFGYGVLKGKNMSNLMIFQKIKI